MIQKGTYKISYPKPEVKVPPWYLLLTLSSLIFTNFVKWLHELDSISSNILFRHSFGLLGGGASDE